MQTPEAFSCSIAPRFSDHRRYGKLFNDVAIVDPELTVAMPRRITAARGMDAFTLCKCLMSVNSHYRVAFDKEIPIIGACLRSGISMIELSGATFAEEYGEDLEKAGVLYSGGV